MQYTPLPKKFPGGRIKRLELKVRRPKLKPIVPFGDRHCLVFSQFRSRKPAVPGNACVPHAVLGVPPNALLLQRVVVIQPPKGRNCGKVGARDAPHCNEEVTFPHPSMPEKKTSLPKHHGRDEHTQQTHTSCAASYCLNFNGMGPSRTNTAAPNKAITPGVMGECDSGPKCR